MKKVLIFCYIIVMCIPRISLATPFNIDSIIRYLNKHYPPKYSLISQITEKYGKRIVFPKKNKEIFRGEELLVLHREKNIPLYLLPQSAVIKITSFFQNKVLGHIMYELGPKPQIGDPITIPAAPVIYLYTNIKDKNSVLIYQSLLQKLLRANYQVVELYKHNLITPSPEYGLLVRLEYDNNEITTKICSIYTGNTLFVKTFKYKKELLTYESPGIPILLQQPKNLAQQNIRQAQASNKPSPLTTQGELSYTLPQFSSQGSRSSFTRPSLPNPGGFIRLRKNYVRVVSCNIFRNGQELALLNSRGVYIVRYTPNGIVPEAHFNLPKGDIPINLHAMDIDMDGRDEIMVTLGREINELDSYNTKLCSMILSVKNNTLVPLVRNFPYYLRVIEDRSGNKVLLAQKKGETDPYTGDIFRLTWDRDTHNLNIKPYGPAKDVYSIYQFNLIPGDKDHIIILEPTNFLSVYYVPTEKVVAISDRSYGNFKITPFRVRLKEPKFLGGFSKQTSKDYYAPRRFVLKHEYANQSFLIDKQRSSSFDITKIKQAILNENAEDSLVGVKWNGQEVIETWRSRPMAKDILDFTFIPKTNKILLLVRDRLGCALITVP